MKRRIIFILSLLLTAAVLAVLFGFSSQTASQSNGVSKEVARLLAEKLPWLMKKLTLRQLNHLLRKLAHFTLYFLLGCGLTGLLRAREKALPVLIAVPIGALCAALDELHQSLVPGRGPGMRDVILDTCGVMAAVGLILLCIFFSRRRKRTKEEGCGDPTNGSRRKGTL